MFPVQGNRGLGDKKPHVPRARSRHTGKQPNHSEIKLSCGGSCKTFPSQSGRTAKRLMSGGC